eukprot:scaffold1673_cov64-Phaeocystis_antarctica.AAC.2
MVAVATVESVWRVATVRLTLRARNSARGAHARRPGGEIWLGARNRGDRQLAAQQTPYPASVRNPAFARATSLGAIRADMLNTTSR